MNNPPLRLTAPSDNQQPDTSRRVPDDASADDLASDEGRETDVPGAAEMRWEWTCDRP
jgi:hypothetical protein